MTSADTVISFHEEARYEREVPKGDDGARWRKEELENIRSNTLKVLRQLSKCGLDEDKNTFMQFTSVRRPLMQHTQSSMIVPLEDHAVEGSSNLFYYLFEDYPGAVSILNTSKRVLDDLVWHAFSAAEGTSSIPY